MFGKKGNMFSKFAAWVGGGILGMVAALPFAAYIPWVQNKAADLAAEWHPVLGLTPQISLSLWW